MLLHLTDLPEDFVFYIITSRIGGQGIKYTPSEIGIEIFTTLVK
jgi:hypothetical protein